MGRLLGRLGAVLYRWASRWVPDPFVLALFLTVVVAVLGAGHLAWGDVPREEGIGWTLVDGWVKGFANSKGLAFALQMALILVTGNAIAISPPVGRGIAAIARLPRTASSATALVAIVSCFSAVVHWGLGFIAGAVLAREIARQAPERGLVIHYPLLGAAAYTGMAVAHGGLSGTAPLKVAQEAPPGFSTIPLTDTLLIPTNVIITGSLILLIPLLCWLLTPRDAECVPADLSRIPPRPRQVKVVPTSAVEWLQESAIPALVVGVGGLALVISSLGSDRIQLDIDSVNLIYLFAGVILHQSLRQFVEAISDAARGAGAIILQFPFYFGILGIMQATDLVPWLSGAMADMATPQTFPLFVFLSACLVNFAVPSGGGQWALQSQVLLVAGGALGVAPGTTVIAFALGDECTNMVQPFWALPILAIMGLRAGEIMGYTAVICLFMLLYVSGLLLLLA